MVLKYIIFLTFYLNIRTPWVHADHIMMYWMSIGSENAGWQSWMPTDFNALSDSSTLKINFLRLFLFLLNFFKVKPRFLSRVYVSHASNISRHSNILENVMGGCATRQGEWSCFYVFIPVKREIFSSSTLVYMTRFWEPNRKKAICQQ